jgi:hypothetical protein
MIAIAMSRTGTCTKYLHLTMQKIGHFNVFLVATAYPDNDGQNVWISSLLVDTNICRIYEYIRQNLLRWQKHSFIQNLINRKLDLSLYFHGLRRMWNFYFLDLAEFTQRNMLPLQYRIWNTGIPYSWLVIHALRIQLEASWFVRTNPAFYRVPSQPTVLPNEASMSTFNAISHE